MTLKCAGNAHRKPAGPCFLVGVPGPEVAIDRLRKPHMVCVAMRVATVGRKRSGKVLPVSLIARPPRHQLLLLARKPELHRRLPNMGSSACCSSRFTLGLARVNFGLQATLASDMLRREWTCPVDPTPRGRLSANACCSRWHVAHVNVLLADNRVS